MSETKDGEAMLTPEQVAVILHRTRATLQRWRRIGIGPRYIRVDPNSPTSRVLYPASGIHEFASRPQLDVIMAREQGLFSSRTRPKHPVTEFRSSDHPLPGKPWEHPLADLKRAPPAWPRSQVSTDIGAHSVDGEMARFRMWLDEEQGRMWGSLMSAMSMSRERIDARIKELRARLGVLRASYVPDLTHAIGFPTPADFAAGLPPEEAPPVVDPVIGAFLIFDDDDACEAAEIESVEGAPRAVTCACCAQLRPCACPPEMFLPR